MTRSEAYAEGFHEGRRWAEQDIRNGRAVAAQAAEFTLDRAWSVFLTSEAWKARTLGQARGYRDTVARFEAGTLTRQMFEMAPRGRP